MFVPSMSAGAGDPQGSIRVIQGGERPGLGRRSPVDNWGLRRRFASVCLVEMQYHLVGNACNWPGDGSAQGRFRLFTKVIRWLVTPRPQPFLADRCWRAASPNLAKDLAPPPLFRHGTEGEECAGEGQGG